MIAAIARPIEADGVMLEVTVIGKTGVGALVSALKLNTWVLNPPGLPLSGMLTLRLPVLVVASQVPE